MNHRRSVAPAIALLPLVLATLVLLCVAPGALADEVVTNCSNDTELRNDWNAIQNNPDGGDLLTFNCGVASIVLTGGYLTNVRHTIVEGHGLITLSGGNSTRIVKVATGGHLRLSNITLTLGNATGAGSEGDGGCIWSDGALELYTTTVQGCYASNDGGGIFSSTHGQVTLGNGSTIRNNIAQRDCGGICEYGTSLSVMEYSTIDGNNAFRSAGGIGGVNDMTVERSTLSNNTAQVDGGGIFTNDQLDVTDSVLIGNRATGFGGGIVNDGGHAAILRSQLSTNYAGSGGAIANRDGPLAPVLSLTDVTISNNVVQNQGGGILNVNGSMSVDSSTLSSNGALFGGGITNYSSNSSTVSAMMLTNVTLTGNIGSLAGGGIYGGGMQTLVHVTLKGNSSTHGGGVYHFSAGVGVSETFSLRNTIIANSSAGGNCFEDLYNGGTMMSSSGSNISTDNTCTPFLTHVSDRNNTNAYLGALRNSGGPTLTHMIFPPSLAIDRGQCVTGTDQRGVTRPIGISCDIGAVEYQPFTDDPVNAGVTVVKAVHITELRARIDQLRARYGAPAFTWMDPSLGATTPVRAQHIVDLRTALGQAYTAASMMPPTYIDPALAAGMPPKAVYINELRAAIITLDLQ